MDEVTISVTLAARNFSDCVNRTRYQGTSFLSEKNGVPVARLIPIQRNYGADLEQLADTLRQNRKTSLLKPEVERLPVQSTAIEGEAKQNQEPARLPKRPTLNW